MCSEWFYSGWYWIAGLRRVHLCLFAPALHVSVTLRIWFGCKVTPYFGARTSIIEVQLIFTPLRGGRPHWDQRFVRLSSSHGHVVLGVPKPNVSYSIIVPLEAINPGIYHIFVSNAKWTKQCYLHSFWSPKKHVQGPAKHARKTYRKCWRFLPLPVFNTDKQETCCFVRNGPVIRKKNET